MQLDPVCENNKILASLLNSKLLCIFARNFEQLWDF